MPQLLQLDSSADLVNSTSRALTARFADTWRDLSPELAERCERTLAPALTAFGYE